MAEIVFVNQEKKERAQLMLDLLTGKTSPKTEEEQDNIKKFNDFFAEAKLKATDEDALEFVYVKLGGLVRTQAEQKAADERKEEAKKKGRRKMIE